jgi:long-chain-fatty-acid---luciferin-component ligase
MPVTASTSTAVSLIEPVTRVERAALVEHTAAPVSDFDRILVDDDMLFRWSAERRAETALAAIRAAAAHHIEACEPYARLCRARGFAADQLNTPADLARVPLVPSSAFKHQALMSCPPEQIVKHCLSSGTQGTVSTVSRDDLTLKRFLGSTQQLADLMLGLPDRGEVFNLGPDSDEAGDLWFAYVMSILELLFPARHYVSRGEYAVHRLIADLGKVPEGVTPILVGPPALFAVLADTVESSHAQLNLGAAGAFAVTAGGWKRRDGEAIDAPTLAAKLTAALGLEGPHRVRDTFNMVELNTVVFECEQHRKHLPPWLHVSAREPGTLELLPAGETGVLAWLDPTAASYPAFLLSDDFGRIDADACPCGRTGESVQIIRRVRKVETRGCALKIDSSTQPAQDPGAVTTTDGSTGSTDTSTATTSTGTTSTAAPTTTPEGAQK